MKTSEFDHIIRDLLLDEASQHDAEGNLIKESIWQKLNPPKTFGMRAIYLRMAAAACISALVVGGGFMIFRENNLSQSMLAQNRTHLGIVNHTAIAQNNSLVQIVMQDRYITVQGKTDTVIISIPLIQPQITLVYDTVYIEREPQQNSIQVLANENNVSPEYFDLSETQRHNIKRSFLQWFMPETSNRADMTQNETPGRMPIRIRL